MLTAMFKRWWYLLTSGTWRGECAVTVWQGNQIMVIGTGRPTQTPGVFQPYRVFWQRSRDNG